MLRRWGGKVAEAGSGPSSASPQECDLQFRHSVPYYVVYLMEHWT